MRTHPLRIVAVGLALAFSARMAAAQCSFEHPKKSKQIKANLIQAFVSCGNFGGNSPNTTTEGAVPSCAPAETYHEQAGSPNDGWHWDPAKASGQLQLKSTPNKVVSILNPPNSADVAIKLKLKGILDTVGGAPASASGTLALVIRWTMNDRVGGDMTVVDFPLGIGFQVINGAANVKTTLNSHLNNISQPGFPHCTSLELVSARIVDPNGNTFATIGVFLP